MLTCNLRQDAPRAYHDLMRDPPTRDELDGTACTRQSRRWEDGVGWVLRKRAKMSMENGGRGDAGAVGASRRTFPRRR